MIRQLRPGIFGFLVSVVAAVDGTHAADTPATPAEPPVIRYERGVVIKAEGGGFKNVLATFTVPMDWPGQQSVQVVKGELPPGASSSAKTLEGVGRQVLVRIPFLGAGQEARAVVTLDVQPLLLPPLPEPAALRLPEAAALDRKVSAYLAPSAQIESDDPLVRKAAEDIAGAKASAWEKVKAIHRWVKRSVKDNTKPSRDHGAALTLRTQIGDGSEKNSLAVALCRAQGIPARLVLVARPGLSDHCYFEFYLADAQGNGHWLAADDDVEAAPRPAAAAQTVLLQKSGEVTAVDPNTKERVKHRLLADSLQGQPQARGAHLQLQSISR